MKCKLMLHEAEYRYAAATMHEAKNEMERRIRTMGYHQRFASSRRLTCFRHLAD
jgi:hypothetical protein